MNEERRKAARISLWTAKQRASIALQKFVIGRVESGDDKISLQDVAAHDVIEAIAAAMIHELSDFLERATGERADNG